MGLLVALASWPVYDVAPQGGLDPSWQAGLHMGAHFGLDHGREIVFSYGPLGFLHLPRTYYAEEFRLALLYAAAIHLALCVTFVWLSRRSFSAPVAMALATVAASLPHLDPVVILAFLWGAIALSGPQSSWSRNLVVIGGAGLAGLELLAKLSSGMAAAVLLGLAAVAMPGRRMLNGAMFTAGTAVVLVVLWLVSGQPLGALGDYVDGARHIVGGFSEAMVSQAPGRSWEKWAALAIAIVVGALALAHAPGVIGPRWGLFALTTVFLFTSFKAGFVRHDHHSLIFFSAMVGAWFAFRWPRGRRGLGLVTLTLMFVAFLGAIRASPKAFVTPLSKPGKAFDQAELALDGRKLKETIAAARRSRIAAYGMDPLTVALLRGRRVHVSPWELTAVWAQQVPWGSPPVFQEYSAYTAELDRKNAERLSSSQGPDRILRQAGQPTVDGRYPAHDSPAAKLAMLCHYRALRTTARWQVLGRAPDRCGAARPLRAVSAPPGQAVQVPTSEPDDVVLARVHGARPAGAERLRSIVYRARDRRIRLAGVGDFRLVPGTAENGLLLRVPPALDFPGGFALGPISGSVAVYTVGAQHGKGRLVYSFYAVAVGPAPPEPRR